MRISRHHVRIALTGLIIVSWIVLLFVMIKEFRTLPSAAEIADERHVRPPLPADLLIHAVASFAEMVFATIMLWPWWRQRYAMRAAFSSLVLAVWFVASVTMDINKMELHHRRWLAMLVLVCVAAAVTAATGRLVRRGHGGRAGPNALTE